MSRNFTFTFTYVKLYLTLGPQKARSQDDKILGTFNFYIKHSADLNHGNYDGLCHRPCNHVIMLLWHII